MVAQLFFLSVTLMSSSTSLFLRSGAYYSIICMESENQHDSQQARKVLWTPHLTLLLVKFFFSPFLILHPIQLRCEFFDSTGNNTTIRELKAAASKSPPAVTATLSCDHIRPHAERGCPPKHLHFNWEFLQPSPFGMYLNTTLNLSQDEEDEEILIAYIVAATWYSLQRTRLQCSCATHSFCCRSTKDPQ